MEPQSYSSKNLRKSAKNEAHDRLSKTKSFAVGQMMRKCNVKRNCDDKCCENATIFFSEVQPIFFAQSVKFRIYATAAINRPTIKSYHLTKK